jgi:hypothetical protein
MGEWRCSSTHSLPRHVRGKNTPSPGYPLDRIGWVGPRTCLDVAAKRKYPYLCQESNFAQASSVVTILTELSWLLILSKARRKLICFNFNLLVSRFFKCPALTAVFIHAVMKSEVQSRPNSFVCIMAYILLHSNSILRTVTV